MAAPTLIVGIGGIGGEIVSLLDDRIQKEGLANVELVAMDTSVNELEVVYKKHPRIYTVQTSPVSTVGRALDKNEYARGRWFPLNDGLMGRTFSEGAGQVRAISRLAFDHAVEEGLMEGLEQAIAKLRGLTGEVMEREMRVIIVGCLGGGTGSGLVLPVAMYIRNFLITRYQDHSAIIRGFFLDPDVVFGRIVDEDERNSQRANAYAAIRELNAFFRKEYSGASEELSHVVFNAPQPGLGVRQDYPNILPYHFVFLMDAISGGGHSLTDAEGRYDLDAYKRHAADCIYAQALSAMTARSNSSEDNVIRTLVANNGLSRYCGAGSSCLEYPKEDVQRHIALNWAEQNLTGEWLEIDNEFETERRIDTELEISSFYTDHFKTGFENGIPFYKNTYSPMMRKDEHGNKITAEKLVEDTVKALSSHARAWVVGSLRKECTELRSWYRQNGESEISTSIGAIDNIIEANEDPSSRLLGDIQSYESATKRLISIAKEEVPAKAKSFAHNSFFISEYDKNPLQTRSESWQIENVLHYTKEGVSGSYHPALVRYVLYLLQDAISEEKDKAETRAANRLAEIQEAEDQDHSVNSQNGEGEGRHVSASQAASEILFADSDSGGGLISRFLGGNKMDEPTKAHLATMGSDLAELRENVELYMNQIAIHALYSAALEYVSKLIAAYEDFYRYLGSGIESIRKEIAGIEYKTEYNEIKGRTHRYVCASTQCLHEMKKICLRTDTVGELDTELCGNIYTRLLRYAGIRSRIQDDEVRVEATKRLLKQMFNETIIDYWMARVIDPHGGYPNVIDKDIVQALGDEGVYLHDDVVASEEERIEIAEEHIRKTLKEAKGLSDPFMEKPIGETPRHIETCAYSEELFEDSVLPYASTVEKRLKNEYKGVCASKKEFSKYEILFYSSFYGFCAADLPKFAPEHKGMEDRPEGEYHRAYYALVSQIGPNPRENRLITPHIDKNWHLVCNLPELNEGYEKTINHDIVHAFIFGLIFQQFDSQRVVDGDDVYYIKAMGNRPKKTLWVSNGTPCDKLYEVFDALKINPPAVSELLDRSESRLEKEKNDTLALPLISCQLLKRIRSQAFKGTFDIDAWKNRIVNSIGKDASADDIPMRVVPYTTSANRRGGRLDSSVIREMFGYFGEETAEATPRTSIFEIPLLYRISLPTTETREGEIDMMVENIFSTIEDHLRNFCDEGDFIPNCCELFEEQYMLFEWNLIGYERKFPGIDGNAAVSAVREKVLSYLEQNASIRTERVAKAQNEFKSAWDRYQA